MNRLCHEQGVELIPYSPLARGFLAANRNKEGGGATERSKNDAQVQGRRLSRLRLGDRRAAEEGRGREECVARADRAQPGYYSKPYMGSPIIGATNLDQLVLRCPGDGIGRHAGRSQAARGALSVPRFAGQLIFAGSAPLRGAHTLVDRRRATEWRASSKDYDADLEVLRQH